MSFEEQERKFTSAILEGFVGLMNMGVDIDKFMTELAKEIGTRKQAINTEKDEKSKNKKRQGEEANFVTPKKTAKTKNTPSIPGPSTRNQYDALSDSETSDMEFENNLNNDEPAVTQTIQITNQNKIPQSF
ncbi:hypothetical protein WA026_021399 [Henosepilachna vigintioctopunctata]|uniref:Uncharacterized protein n=1 Tax=Henosepilachna vigintioctopunctata TaxID=420089 RepID=A0AAW1TYH8_9CUCU